MSFIEFTRALGSSVDFALTLVDLDQHDQPLIFVNNPFCEMTGFKESDILGKNCRFLNSNHREQSTLSVIRESIANSKAVHIDLINNKYSGEDFGNRLVLLPIMCGDRKLSMGLQHEIPIAKCSSNIDHEMMGHIFLNLINSLYSLNFVQGHLPSPVEGMPNILEVKKELLSL